MNRFLCAVAFLSALAGCARAQQAQKQVSNEQKDPIALGRSVYETNCVSCHGPGIGNPGAELNPVRTRCASNTLIKSRRF